MHSIRPRASRVSWSVAAGVAGFLTLSLAVPARGQTSEYYLHTGDPATFSVVQNGIVIREWGGALGTDRFQHAMAVRGTVRTMGGAANAVGAEYSLTGRDIGSRYVHPPGTTVCWDGTTDGVYNYSIDTSGGVYRFDLDWSNPVLLFSAGGLGSLTYDPLRDSLWVGLYHDSTEIVQYARDGRRISAFSVGHARNVALALDHADGTLWLHDHNRPGTFEQWTRNGRLLQTHVINIVRASNTFSGEFRFSTGRYTCSVGGRCPGTVRIVWSDAPVGTQQGLLFARRTGSFIIPSGRCEGTRLGLGADGFQLASVFGTGDGSGAINRMIGAAACRGYIQLVALDTPCATSNVVRLPW